jgi:hypothetical protein
MNVDRDVHFKQLRHDVRTLQTGFKKVTEIMQMMQLELASLQKKVKSGGIEDDASETTDKHVPQMNQMGMNQMGATQIGANQMGANQMGMNQMGMNQMGMNQMGMNINGMGQEDLDIPTIQRLLQQKTNMQNGVPTMGRVIDKPPPQ